MSLQAFGIIQTTPTSIFTDNDTVSKISQGQQSMHRATAWQITRTAQAQEHESRGNVYTVKCDGKLNPSNWNTKAVELKEFLSTRAFTHNEMAREWAATSDGLAEFAKMNLLGPQMPPKPTHVSAPVGEEN